MPTDRQTPIRAVLVGASNLARGLAPALLTAHQLAARPDAAPPHLFVATGRGRAYSCASSLLWRGLPSIIDCGLWRALDAHSADRGEGPIVAALTDLGNDLAYGVDEHETFDAVSRVLEQLQNRGARPTVTSLPLASLERFSFTFLDACRRILFPGSRVPAKELLRRAQWLNDRLRQHCSENALPWLEQPASWFGLDPIHHLRRCHPEIWRAVLAPWADTEVEPAPESPFGLRARLLSAAWPEQFHLAGRSLGRQQPAFRLAESVDISFY